MRIRLLQEAQHGSGGRHKLPCHCLVVACNEFRRSQFALEARAALPGIVVSLHRTSGEFLADAIDAFQASSDFLDLADSSRRSYIALIKRIEKKFSDFPLSAMTNRRTRGIFKEWRDSIAAKSGRRQADYAWSVLARVLSWGLDRGLVLANPCERGGRLYRASRNEKIWTDNDEASFLKHAPEHLHPALLLGLWTGQRQGDLLRLPWSAYDGTHIRLRQSKTGARVSIPVGAPLKAALDDMARAKHGPIILTSTDKQPWTSDGFRSSWGKACEKAGIVGVTFK